MKPLKKWIALALTLCILLSSMGAAMAVTVTYSEGSSVMDGDTQYVVSLANVNDELYVLYADGRLVRVNPATREETSLGKALPTSGMTADMVAQSLAQPEFADSTPMEMLFADDNSLYGLCVATGAYYSLLNDVGEYAPTLQETKLDTAAMVGEQEGMPLTLVDPCVVNGVLYYITVDYATGSMATKVASIDLASGTAKAYAVQNLQNLTAYKDGKLLVRQYDMSSMYTTGTSELPGSAYGVFDPAADVFTAMGEIAAEGVLGGYSISGLRYSAANDTLYYTNGSRIEGMDMSTQEVRTSAYTGEGMVGGAGNSASIALIGNAYYASGSYSGLDLYALDSDAVKNGAMRIFGEFGTEMHKSFTKNYPDIPVEVASDYTNSIEQLANAMVSENDAYDVLKLITSNMPVEKLISKGYSADLSQYPEIMERVAKLDKRFVDAMTVDGKLYGVPVGSTAYTYGVNMEKWEELGLTKEDLPTNLIELYDFTANYMADYGEDNPDLKLFDMEGDTLRTMLFSMMLDNYITYTQAALNGNIEFDSELTRQVLTAFEQIDFSEYGATGDADSVNALSMMVDAESLFSIYTPVTIFSSYYDKITPLFLSLTPDTEALVGANLSVLMINPKTKRMDDAIKYVCNYLDNLDNSSAIVLNPDDNEPRLAKDYEKNLKQMQDEIDKRKALLETAEESQKATIQAEITQAEEQLVEYEKYKYDVSAEQITRFREEVSDKLVVTQQSVLYSADESASNEMNSLIMQYLSGSTTQDQFLKEMDRRARMMVLENQ